MCDDECMCDGIPSWIHVSHELRVQMSHELCGCIYESVYLSSNLCDIPWWTHVSDKLLRKYESRTHIYSHIYTQYIWVTRAMWVSVENICDNNPIMYTCVTNHVSTYGYVCMWVCTYVVYTSILTKISTYSHNSTLISRITNYVAVYWREVLQCTPPRCATHDTTKQTRYVNVYVLLDTYELCACIQVTNFLTLFMRHDLCDFIYELRTMWENDEYTCDINPIMCI